MYCVYLLFLLFFKLLMKSDLFILLHLHIQGGLRLKLASKVTERQTLEISWKQCMESSVSQSIPSVVNHALY